MSKTLKPQDLAFADTAPWLFDMVGRFDATLAEVWAAFIDNEGWIKWMGGCKKCHATSTPFDGVGSTRFIDVAGLKVNERFIGWEPEKLWAFTVIDLNFGFAKSMVERAQFNRVGNQTEVTYRIAIEPATWAKPIRPLMARQTARAFNKGFVKLNTLLS